MNPEILEKINKFTRRPLAEDEVYVFSVILCDNEIDRDCECFSDNALDVLRDSFIGKTGIFDHNPSTANQTARIFDTELVTDESRLTAYGKPYKYLKASAYTVRTEENKSFIAEIDGGIKKEVSISCSASKRICSVCGNDKAVNSCSHVKGKKYGGTLCHTILDGITDTYEWSFVAVPAQVNAGVTKHYSIDGKTACPVSDSEAAAADELRRDIRRLAFFSGGRDAADAVSISCRSMSTVQLISMKKALENRCGSKGVELQLADFTEKEESTSAFSMK